MIIYDPNSGAFVELNKRLHIFGSCDADRRSSMLFAKVTPIGQEVQMQVVMYSVELKPTSETDAIQAVIPYNMVC